MPRAESPRKDACPPARGAAGTLAQARGLALGRAIDLDGCTAHGVHVGRVASLEVRAVSRRINARKPDEGFTVRPRDDRVQRVHSRPALAFLFRPRDDLVYVLCFANVLLGGGPHDLRLCRSGSNVRFPDKRPPPKDHVVVLNGCDSGGSVGQTWLDPHSYKSDRLSKASYSPPSLFGTPFPPPARAGLTRGGPGDITLRGSLRNTGPRRGSHGTTRASPRTLARNEP